MVIHRAGALLLALLASNSMAASFDCTKASNFAEKEICRDGYLSGLDKMLSSNYKAALEATDQPDALRQSQREWLAIRDQCNTQKCLDQSMGTRITALEHFASAERGKALELESQRESSKAQAESQAALADRVRRIHEADVAAEQVNQQRRQAQQQAILAQQQTAAVTKISSGYPSAAQPSYQQQQAVSLGEQEDGYWQPVFSVLWKCALIMAIISSCWAVKRHRQKEATIYNDYTDATITNLLPVTGFIIGLICGWLGMPHQVYQICVMTGLLSAALFAIYAAIKTNHGGLNILLTTIAKLTFISIFYVIMGFLIFSLLGRAQRKGESLTQAEARRRREARETKVAIVATSAGYTFFTAWVCRRPMFTSLSECLEFEPASRIADYG